MRIETEVLGVDSLVLGRDSNLVGDLRVTTVSNTASTVLMPIFSSFSRAYPRVNLHLTVSNADISLAQREADVAIRYTNSPTDTLIGKRLVTAASTIYGNRDYLKRIREQGQEPKWIGVECCEFHKSWTRHACDEQTHNFYSDDTLLTLAAIREGLGVSFLQCFLGDVDPDLERLCEPDPSHNLGLWILLHPDMKRTARVLAFRDHMIESIDELKKLFEGKCAHPN